jgi:hypothetical protein
MATTASVKEYQIQARIFNADLVTYITLFGTAGTTAVSANIGFIKTGKPIPAPLVGAAAGPHLIETYLPEASYLSWVDLLRNEKPLTMNVNGANLYVQTGRELVGAHEIGA